MVLFLVMLALRQKYSVKDAILLVAGGAVTAAGLAWYGM